MSFFLRILGYIRNFGLLMFFFAIGKGLHILFTDDNDSIVVAIVFGLLGLGIAAGFNAIINRKSVRANVQTTP